MKKLLAVSLIFCLLLASVPGSADLEIPPLTNCVIKYNSVATTLGTATINEEKFVESDGWQMCQCGGYVVGFTLDESGNITAGTVVLQNSQRLRAFLFACVTMVTFLGGMDYTAYGHLLPQYIRVFNGEEQGLGYICGFDVFNFYNKDNGIIFVYNNIDLKTWY